MNHIIKKQTLSISIPEGYDAWSMQDTFKEVFNKEVLPRLEKVCDELDLDKRFSLKLDRLTIDTGTFSNKELTSLWVDEVEKAFRNELLNHTKERLNEKPSADSISSEEPELGALIYFLKNGVLPWWVSAEFKLSPEELLTKVLAEQPKKLVSEILRIESKAAVVKRLLYQFESKTIRQLLKLFKPTKQVTVLQQFKKLCRGFKVLYPKLETSFLATEISISLDPDEAGANSKQLFELLLRHISKESATSDKTTIVELHKQLTSNQKSDSKSISLEDRKIIALALKAINQGPDSGIAAPDDKDERVKTATTQKSVSKRHSGDLEQQQLSPDSSPTKEPKDHTNSDQTSETSRQKADPIRMAGITHADNAEEQNSEHESSESSETDSKIEETFSAQDQRAWEQIERIKKLQLAKLVQDEENRERIDQSNIDSERTDDKSLQNNEQTLSPSEPSEVQAGKPEDTENSPKTDSELPVDPSQRTEAELHTKTQEKTETTSGNKNTEEVQTDLGNKNNQKTGNKLSAEIPERTEAELRAKTKEKTETASGNKNTEETQTDLGNKNNQKAGNELSTEVHERTEAELHTKTKEKPETASRSKNNQKTQTDLGNKNNQKAGNELSTEVHERTESDPLNEARKKPGSKQLKDKNESRLQKTDDRNVQQDKHNLPEIEDQTQSKESHTTTDKARQQATDSQEQIPPQDQAERSDNTNTETESEKVEQQTQNSERKQTAKAEPDNQKGRPFLEAESRSATESSDMPKTDDTKQSVPTSTDSLGSRKPDKDSLEYWQEELESIDECYIQNAGLILFWPYLGHFFKDMGLLTEGAFKTKHDQMQAALVLQHLLSTDPELHEYRLPLNKLLCGLKISEPVGKTIELSAEDLTRCDNLLQAAIQNWTALKSTSTEGFQTSFLQRNGVLKRKDKNWLLQVEKMPFDMLMEQLPWPIGIVKLSWMNKPIYVEW